jgi:hypothetical protein
MIAFCAWRRFSASSKITECGPSITAPVASSFRWAGRQCMERRLHGRFVIKRGGKTGVIRRSGEPGVESQLWKQGLSVRVTAIDR